MKILSVFSNVFRIFRDKESYFNQITQESGSGKLLLKQLLVVCLFAFVYGIVMGCYHSFAQSISAGVKLIILFVSTIIICFPSFYIIQLIMGSRLKILQMMNIVLSGFVLGATIMISFAPIIIFFLVTGNNYYFLQLLHIAIFIFAGVFAMKLIIDALKFACEKENVYPQTGVVILRIWIIILAFVGIQLAWNLRPFMGDKNEFKLFRDYEGNFYTALIYSFKQLGAVEETDKPSTKKSTLDYSDFQDPEDTTSLLHQLNNEEE